MAIEKILTEIDAEIARLKQARALLANLGSATTKAPVMQTKAPAKVEAAKKRVLSPEARAKIAAAQHRRWAKQKAKTKAKE
jgi:translation initiation factor 2 gamma subunit (eIF-2gamma)